MAYDFPNSPSIGQVANGYVWDGEKWMRSGPLLGPVVATKKNYIINGAMQISQEWGSTVLGTTGNYPVDQWVFHTAGPAVNALQVAQVAVATPAGSLNRLRAVVGTAYATVGATDFAILRQPIEGLRVADLRFGSAVAKTVTIQFGCKGPAGIYSATITNPALNRGYAAEFTIASGEANTDVVKSATIPLDTTGTWPSDNTAGMFLHVTLMAGASYKQVAGSWIASAVFGGSNQFNFMGTAGNVFELFDVSLTEGSVAPPFQVPDYASELALCKRYWQKLGGAAGVVSFRGYQIGGSALRQTILFPVEMRASPAMNVVGTWTFSNSSLVNASGIDTKSIAVGPVATATGDILAQTSDAAAGITLNARL